MYVSICSFYIFVISVYLHPSAVTDTHTIRNLTTLYNKSFLFEAPSVAGRDPALFTDRWPRVRFYDALQQNWHLLHYHFIRRGLLQARAASSLLGTFVLANKTPKGEKISLS
jgi:hypothetical protein